MKNSIFFKGFTSVLIAATLFFSACRQESLTLPKSNIEEAKSNKTVDLNLDGITVKNGALQFRDKAIFNNAIMAFNQAQYNDYKAFCDKLGFISLETISGELTDNIEQTVKSKSELTNFLKQNEDIFTLEGDEMVLNTSSMISNRLINREKIYYIGETLYGYEKEGLIIVPDGDIEKYHRLRHNGALAANEKSFFIPKQSLRLETRAACLTAPNSGWINNSSGNRRGIVYQGTEHLFNFQFSDPVTGTSSYSVDVMSFAQGRAQKKTTFIWNDYSTDHTLGVSQTLSVFTTLTGSNTTTQTFNEPPFSFTNTQRITFLGFMANYPLVVFDSQGCIIQFSGCRTNLHFRDLNLSNVSNSYSNSGGVSITFTCQ